MAGRGGPGTGRAWATVVACVLTFFALNVLVVRGSGLALDLLVFLSGMLVGGAVARLASLPVRRATGGSENRRILALFAGLASVFVIIFGGTALAGIPPYPTAEGGQAGNAIYGLALGFGIGLPGGLAPAGPRAPAPGSGAERKAVALIAGTVAALFSVLLVLYLVLEYAVVPLVRALAA